MTTTPSAPRGRPRTGRTPDTERQRKSLADLKNAGGRMVRYRAQFENAKQIDAIMAARDLNQQDAITWALSVAIKKLR